MLPLHLAGGLLSLLAVGVGFYASASGYKRFRWLVPVLPLLAAWQVVTGVLLLLEGASAVRMCISGVAYLALMGWVEWRLVQSRTGPVKTGSR